MISVLFALYEAIKEALWLKSKAKNVNINVNNVSIYEDNNGYIAIANNPSSYKLAKHRYKISLFQRTNKKGQYSFKACYNRKTNS